MMTDIDWAEGTRTKAQKRDEAHVHNTWASSKGAGGDLLFHRGNPAVPSAQEGLTTEFGMGSGGTPPL